MKQAMYITTSWDDGSPHDLRVAELLARYGLCGTFYVPRRSEHGVMSDREIAQLSADFDIGGHTLDHLPLTQLEPGQANAQIAGGKSWLEQVTGKPCRVFCPPLGRFGKAHLPMMRAAGFIGLRTVELLSLDAPRPVAGLRILPTTLQAYPHGRVAYIRNLAKRAALGNFWRQALSPSAGGWTTLATSLAQIAAKRGGVYHLWGHSWEVEETGQWKQLEEVLRMLSALGKMAIRASNLALLDDLDDSLVMRECPAVAEGDLAPTPSSPAQMAPL
jgi:peptidoglycan/xylan/chitin deacetylase (PgdA/CDA1 family)